MNKEEEGCKQQGGEEAREARGQAS